MQAIQQEGAKTYLIEKSVSESIHALLFSINNDKEDLLLSRKSNGNCWNINTFNRVTGGGKLGRLAYMTSSTKPAQTSLRRVHSLVNQSEQSTLSTRMSSEIWPSQK
ncbi:hypothetical protein D5086_021516 [Populus alba]|uniref:Uncharacterized protein n=1 Tax=Populus alba TaxID=43335 RepID=A0ACC4BCD7_POPAL